MEIGMMKIVKMKVMMLRDADPRRPFPSLSSPPLSLQRTKTKNGSHRLRRSAALT